MRTLSEQTTVVETRSGESIDMRRRLRREMVDVIVARSSVLAPADAALVQSVYGDGRSIASVAVLLGCDERKVRRRVKRLVARLGSAPFLYVLSHRHTWPSSRRRVAEACFLRGLSIRQAADELKLTYHAVRRQVEAVGALIQAGTS